MNDLIADFEAYNRVKNLSPKTLIWYTAKLTNFALWLDGGDPLQVSARTIRGYLSEKMGQGFKPATVRGYFDALRAFYGYLVADEVIEDSANPMRKISPPRVPLRAIEPLAEGQIQALLSTFDTRSAFGYRDYVICLLILDTGLRVSEVTRLRIGDLSLEESRLAVMGKGNKRRYGYLGQRMMTVLKDYLDYARPVLAKGSDMLFPSYRMGGHLYPHALSRIMQGHFDAAGITREGSVAHRLRHTFAVSLLRNGANAFCLQRLLGHSTLTMTKRYVMLSELDLSESHRRASPVDRLGFFLDSETGGDHGDSG